MSACQTDAEYIDEVMAANVADLRDVVVGHRIVAVVKTSRSTEITLDSGKKVRLRNTDDCCAYTELESFLLNPELVDHVIMGVDAEEGYETWHIFADMGDVLTLTVDWSPGNVGHYGFGFAIKVVDA